MEERQQAQFRKMTEEPVPRLVVTLGIPTVVSMLVTNLYNMADTYFVSTLGNSASGATGIVFALMAIIQAFGFMLGHGAGSIISRRLGSQQPEEARKYSSTSFYLSLLVGLMIFLLGMVFQVPLMRVLGSTDSILPYARTYSTFILISAPAFASSCVLNNILRYEGKAFYAMLGLVSGALLNIFGDYLLVVCVGMGIAGAGLSTMVAQYISVVVLMVPFLQHKVQSRLSPCYFTPKGTVIPEIISVGLPSLMRQGLNSVSVMVLNLCAAPYGDAAIAAMSIVSRVINFLFCVALGIGQGFQPVCAFNYGARRYNRVKQATLFTIGFNFTLMLIAAVLGFTFASPVVAFFRDDPDVIAIGSLALRFQSVSLVMISISVCGNMLFQSTGKSLRATLLAATRSGLFFIPVVLILSQAMGLRGIQMAQMVADILSAMVTLPMIAFFLYSFPEDGMEHL